MATSKKNQHWPTARVRDEKYWVHDRHSFTPWTVLVKADGNEKGYVPVYRTGWADGRAVEIFSLLPAEGCGDTLLVQVRIYTNAQNDDGKDGIPYPDITTQCGIPAFVQIEPEKHRILIALLCRLEARPEEHRLLVEPEPEIEVEFL